MSRTSYWIILFLFVMIGAAVGRAALNYSTLGIGLGVVGAVWLFNQLFGSERDNFPQDF